MKTKVVYVTGCLGFIGFYVAKRCLEEGYYVIGVDKITYAANSNLLYQLDCDRFKFIHSDINDLERLSDCDYVINCAAESHVDNSIISSEVFLRSNINGVHHLLELIKQKSLYNMPTLLHFSTDEVYGDIETGAHIETDLLKPSNPYSASKAAADMLVLAWARTFKTPYVIVRPTNNYGIGQYAEKLIPKSCKHLMLGKKIDVHDHGKPYRTWLHASDTAEAVLAIIKSGVKNEIYNINGNYECQNIEVIRKIIEWSENDTDYEKYLTHFTRPGHDVRYALNDDKLKALGWKAVAVFDNELKKIVEHSKTNFIW
jgi:dTDP-glucose 4,6-dehydratase